MTPGRASGKEGDVIRFTAVAKNAAGRVIEGLTPVWSFSPGNGSIDPDGAFVGYEPGAYVVSAELPGVKKEDIQITIDGAQVTLAAQDAPAIVERSDVEV